MDELVGTKDTDGFFSYGSCMVLLSAFTARIVHENTTTLGVVAARILASTHRLVACWVAEKTRRRESAIVSPDDSNIPITSCIDDAEGARGVAVFQQLSMNTTSSNDLKVLPVESKVEVTKNSTVDTIEWTERDRILRREKPPPWHDLTHMVTLQWCIDKEPNRVVRFVLDAILKDPGIPSRLSMEAKKSRRNELSTAGEDRIYCVTHVVLVLSEFGSRPISLASPLERSALEVHDAFARPTTRIQTHTITCVCVCVCTGIVSGMVGGIIIRSKWSSDMGGESRSYDRACGLFGDSRNKWCHPF